MLAYIIRRLLLMIPTLFGMMLITYVIVQFAPGGPIDQIVAELEGIGDATQNFTGGGSEAQQAQATSGGESRYNRASNVLSPEQIEELEKEFGFDKPPVERFVYMMGRFIRFDFGESYFKQRKVVCFHLSKDSFLRSGDGEGLHALNPFNHIPVKTENCLVNDALPVSVSLGLWVTFISYFISVPLGIAKATRDGTNFDIWTSALIIIGYAIPGFILAIFLIILFAGGSFYQIFPLRGLTSEGFENMTFIEQVIDYAWHMTLPIIAMGISAFATITLLTKNSFIDEINKQYVITARAKGLKEKRILYHHVFRNAMLIIIAGFPAAFISSFFTGSLLIETMFSLDGLGLLGYNAIVERDYPIVFATLYVFGLMGLLINLLSDVIYMWVDPRIDFENRKV